MNHITYGTIRETYCMGETSRTAYGIVVYEAEVSDTCILFVIHDISPAKERIDDLVGLCNKHQLAPEHLADVVEDFLET